MVLQFVLKFFRLPGVLAVALAGACFALGAEVAKKPFDLPADVAARSLKAFAQQSGVEILIRAELGREIRTQLVKGEFTPREALDRMLIHTGLAVKEDEQTGVMAIMAAPDANVPKKPRDPTSDSQSSAKKNAPTMKSRNPIALLIGWFAFAFTPTPEARAADSRSADATVQQTGSITGRVTNAATGKPLEGARVELQGTGRGTTTDFDGEYRFTEVALRAVTVSVSYTGLNTVDESATVNSGAPTRHDVALTADIYRLSKFVVSGEREGNAQSITLQKQSSGVKNIVSTDAFGSLAGNPVSGSRKLGQVEC